MGSRAMRRGLALVLASASACAQGVGLEGSGPEAGTTGAGTTAMATPTEVADETTVDASSSGDDTTTTSGAPPTTDETTEGDTSTGADTTGGEDLPHPELYPYGRTHSPITAYVAERMRAIAPLAAADNVFAKVGGTMTASDRFQKCLGNSEAVMMLPPELEATRVFFNTVDLGNGTTSFTRDSLAAMLGWSSVELRAGMPSPVASEAAAIHPRFAHVLTGTEDLGTDQPAAMFAFADNLLDTVDELMVNGAVPILSTIPQRTDMPTKAAWLPRYNAIIRAAAQGRQIPLVDLEFAVSALPMFGLAADGVDLSVFDSAMVDRPCFFSEAGLAFGYNVRNLESLRALDRARQVVVDQVVELDAATPGLVGSGTVADPYEITSLPFVDLRSTADSASDVFDSYGGACDGTKDESGPEVVYRLTVGAAVNVRVLAFDRGLVDVDVHVMNEADAATCLKRNDREVTGMLPPGDYTVVVDSYAGDVAGGAVGEYVLLVLAD